MKTTFWTILSGVIVTALVVVAVVYALSSGVPVEVAVVKRGRIQEFVDERAKTRLPETCLITMPVDGRIEAIPLIEGTAVKKGQVVAQIVPRDLELSVKQATAAVGRLQASILENADVQVEKTALTQAEHFVQSMVETVKAAAARMKSGQAKFDYAETNYGRISKAAQTGAATPDDLDRAALQKIESSVDYQQDELVHAAMVAMQAATNLMPTMVGQFIDRKQLKEDVLVKQKTEAEVQLERILQDEDRGKMESPVDGVVLKRLISNERFLGAGETLLEIGQLEDLEIETDVLSLDVVDVREGDPVEVYGPAIGRPTARGKVVRVYPGGFTKISSLGVEQQRVKVIIRLDAADHQRLVGQGELGVGYRVRVKVFTEEKSNALIIPRSALFRDSRSNWQVYAVRDGRAEIQEVTVGLINDKWVEVATGLSEGERVVLAPESNLSDGTRVELEQDSDS